MSSTLRKSELKIAQFSASCSRWKALSQPFNKHPFVIEWPAKNCDLRVFCSASYMQQHLQAFGFSLTLVLANLFRPPLSWFKTIYVYYRTLFSWSAECQKMASVDLSLVDAQPAPDTRPVIVSLPVSHSQKAASESCQKPHSQQEFQNAILFCTGMMCFHYYSVLGCEIWHVKVVELPGPSLFQQPCSRNFFCLPAICMFPYISHVSNCVLVRQACLSKFLRLIDLLCSQFSMKPRNCYQVLSPGGTSMHFETNLKVVMVWYSRTNIKYRNDWKRFNSHQTNCISKKGHAVGIQFSWFCNLQADHKAARSVTNQT